MSLIIGKIEGSYIGRVIKDKNFYYLYSYVNGEYKVKNESGKDLGERMDVQMRSLDQDNRNTQNGNSMLKVAEGAVANTVEIISTLKEKVLNAANDTNTDSDRSQIQKELDQMVDQIDDNANVTYNGKYLVDGSHNKKVTGVDPLDPSALTGEGTFTHLTNRSFHSETEESTKLTDLRDSTGRNLGIQIGDTITVSWVKEGKTNILSYTVGFISWN